MACHAAKAASGQQRANPHDQPAAPDGYAHVHGGAGDEVGRRMRSHAGTVCKRRATPVLPVPA
jgi:hypothetical protein